MPEQILVGDETPSEEAQGVLEERVVVLAVKDRRLDITNKVFEERADDDVDDLADLQIHCLSQRRACMERLEVLTARDVFLCSLLVELIECCVGELLLVDGAAEVKGDIVHEERLQLLLQPHNRLVGLHVDIESAEHGFLLNINVWNQLKRLHVNGDADPIAQLRVNVLALVLVFSMASDFLEVQHEVCLQLSHIELEVADLGQLVHLLDKEHCVILRCGHEQVVICQPHQTVEFDAILGCLTGLHSPVIHHLVCVTSGRCSTLRVSRDCSADVTDFLPSQELQLAILQIGVVEATEDVADTKALWNSFSLLELLLVKRDVVVASNVLQRGQQVVFDMLLTLFLLHYNCPLKVQIIRLLKNIK